MGAAFARAVTRRSRRGPRRLLSTREQLLVGRTAGVYSVESRPGGPVYFSDATSIRKLVLV
jgi:hypothetical protein